MLMTAQTNIPCQLLPDRDGVGRHVRASSASARPRRLLGHSSWRKKAWEAREGREAENAETGDGDHGRAEES